MNTVELVTVTFRTEHARIVEDRPYLPLDLVGRLAWGKVAEALAYRIAHREAWNTWRITNDRDELLAMFRRVEDFRQVRTARSIARQEAQAAR